jgi:protein-tyrosine phosphatase
VIDLHSHVLAGIDDGPKTIEGSIAIARAAAAGGTRTLVATPHISWRHPSQAGTIAGLVDELNDRLVSEQLGLEIRRAAEIAVTRLPEIEPAELSQLGYDGGPWLLIEPPFTTAVGGLDIVVADLQRRGYRIVLAHPERCHGLHRDPLLLGALVRRGVVTSITAGSLAGAFGETVRRFALQLAREGLVHNVASDAHDDVSRPPSMASEIDQAGLGPLKQWLTEEVPAAILGGEGALPPRPYVRLSGIDTRRRGPWWRRVRDLRRAW